MTPEDWDRIKQVFSAALSVPAAERDAHLRAACAGRDDLRRAVDDLLRAHYDASRTFLEPESLVFTSAWLFRAGDRVADRFTVIRRIARGAMGEVYEVHDERLRVRVALKAIRPELIGDADTVARFKREVFVTREIAHEGLCRIFDLVEHPLPSDWGLPQGTVVPCLTMQLLEGTTLEDSLARHRPMEHAEALPLIRQISEALQVLHTAGIVHRDLKPSNVMLLPAAGGHRAVLTDFGLARPIDEGLFKTQGSGVGGAPYFMAPELLRGDRPSRASDIYALGLLIDEMVTRTRAFSADSLHGLLLQKLGDGPARPSLRSHRLPKRWETTILRCLSADPRERFASAEAVRAALVPATRSWRRLGLDWASPVIPRRRWRMAAYLGGGAISLMGALSLTPVSEPPPHSVVVVPFANLTGQPESEYLSAGTASEFGRRLNALDKWRVYLAKDRSVQVDPARAMFVVRGSVQQEGSTLRITAELSDTADGALLWSERFDGARDAPLELEDRLAQAALAALTAAAQRKAEGPFSGPVAFASSWKTPRPPGQLRSPPTANNEAYDAYMRGRYLSEERSLKSTLTAIELYERAVKLDPAFAAAYAGLADAQSVLMESQYAPHDTLLVQRDEYASEAVTLDPNLPEAQLALAAVRQMQSRWAEADTAYRRALALHPAFARAYRSYGGMLLQFGRLGEAVELCQRAIELDPYDVPNQSAYGLVLFYARRPLEAVQQLERLLGEHDHVPAHFILGQVYAGLAATGAPARADYLRKALQQETLLRQKKTAATDHFADFIGALAWSYQGDVKQAQPFLQSLEADRAGHRVSSSYPARIYAVQRRPADALAALAAAEAEQDRELMYLGVSPVYDEIRSEPQFRALMTRLKLVP